MCLSYCNLAAAVTLILTIILDVQSSPNFTPYFPVTSDSTPLQIHYVLAKLYYFLFSKDNLYLSFSSSLLMSCSPSMSAY